MKRSFFVLIAAAAIAGCSGFGVYKIPIQQGNALTQEIVARVKPGMTKAEVRNAIGTPLLSSAFHASRWDYYFSNARDGRVREERRVTLVFENDLLAKIEGDVSSLPAK